MAHDIHGVSPRGSAVTPDVPPVRLDWQRVKVQLGLTNAEIAEMTGMPLRTLDRLRERPEVGQIRNAIRLRRATGISLDELFPDDDATGLAA